MNIINVNSKFHLTQSQIELTDKVLESLPSKSSNSFYDIARKVPIFLVDEDKFKMKSDIEYNNKNHDESPSIKMPPIEYLGYYTRNLDDDSQEIYLCLSRFFNCAEDSLELDVLVLLVIIHEVAHAFMDLERLEFNYDSRESKLLEESSANELTLYVIKNHVDIMKVHDENTFTDSGTKDLRFNPNEELLAKVIELIKRQPSEYKLGYYLYESGIFFWSIWMNEKEKIFNRVYNDKKLDWVNYCNIAYKDEKSIGEFIGKTKNIIEEIKSKELIKKVFSIVDMISDDIENKYNLILCFLQIESDPYWDSIPEKYSETLADIDKHYYDPKYEGTSVRDIAKFNRGEIYGIF